MSIKVSIHDEGSGLLQQVALISYTAGLEALSKSGNRIRDNARRSMESKTHHWVKEFINGEMHLKFDSTQTRQLGYRMSHSDGGRKNPSNMSSMITSYLMPKNGVVVIGGKHKRFKPMIFRDGEFKGYGSSVSAVGKETHAIIHKLNTGEKNEHYKEGLIENKRPRPYKFMDEGYARSRGYISDTMGKALVSLIGKKVNTSKIKVRQRVG